jgi:creatinine amidohydrolase
MRIAEMNWMQAEHGLATEDRCVLPIGSVEQHAYLSLATDVILAERVAAEAAAPLQVPVFPPLAYGFTPSFTAYPGTLSLRLCTLLAVMRDLLTGLHTQGYRRIVVVNGHGGNSAVASLASELMAEHTGLQVKLHNWWNAPQTLACVRSIEPESSHASWMENLPWTRVPDARMPAERKPPVDMERYRLLAPREVRALAGDGNFGGSHVRSDDEVLRMWAVAVAETRDVIQGPWR